MRRRERNRLKREQALAAMRNMPVEQDFAEADVGVMVRADYGADGWTLTIGREHVTCASLPAALRSMAKVIGAGADPILLRGYKR